MPRKRYTYSKRAERDLISIYKDTAKTWGIAQADKYDTGLESAIQLLADNPDLGRSCDDIKTGFKRFEHESHIVFYRKRKTNIFIVRILHNRRDVKRHL